jgi:hypothetical protein
MAVDAFLKCGDALKGDVPPVLKFARDKTFRRIDGFVPSGGQRSIEACFLKFPTESLTDISVNASGLMDGPNRGFDGVPRDGLDDLRGDGLIDADATDADAQPSADMAIVSAAMITMGMTGS